MTSKILETQIVILSVKPNGNLNESPSEQSEFTTTIICSRKISEYTYTVFKKMPIVSEFNFKVLSPFLKGHGLYESSTG